MCNKAVNIYSAIKLIPECYKTSEICDEAVDTCPFVFNAVSDQYKIQEMCHKVNTEDPLLC